MLNKVVLWYKRCWEHHHIMDHLWRNNRWNNLMFKGKQFHTWQNKSLWSYCYQVCVTFRINKRWISDIQMSFRSLWDHKTRGILSVHAIFTHAHLIFCTIPAWDCARWLSLYAGYICYHFCTNEANFFRFCYSRDPSLTFYSGNKKPTKSLLKLQGFVMKQR